jgi:recombination protein RecT
MQNSDGNQSLTSKEAKPVTTLRDLLSKSKGQIALALPKHLTADRMIRVATTAFLRSPQLQECVPLSIVSCVIQAAELGLELGGVLGQCYMVPRYNKNIGGKEAVFQIGYRGLIDLAMRSGRVDSMPLRIVYTNDLFSYAYGTKQYIRHTPSDEGPPPIQDPSLPYPDNVKAVYCVLNVKGSTRPDFEVMTTAAIESHRKRFAPDSYKGSFSGWKTSWEAMAMKTPCRRLAKRAPVSVEFQKAALLDEYGESGVQQGAMLELGELDAGSTPQLTLADKLRATTTTAHVIEPGEGEGESASKPAPQQSADTSELAALIEQDILLAKDQAQLAEAAANLAKNQATLGESAYAQLESLHRQQAAKIALPNGSKKRRDF